MNVQHETRNGMTLIEVLVSMGIVGLLTAILIPAVQNSREAARLMQCRSNMKQIVLSFHEYESSKGTFPGFPENPFEPWHYAILPYLEETKPTVTSNGHVSKTIPVSTFACPTDVFATGELSNMSYVINDGSGGRNDGFYSAVLRSVRAADVADGLSNTVAIAERLAHLDIKAQVQTDFNDALWVHRIIRKTKQYQSDLDLFAEECEANSTLPKFSLYQADGIYNHIQSPNRRSCTNGNRNDPLSSKHAAITSTSMHVGGVNVGMGDGSVRFVSDSINRDLWRSIGTRAGGETMTF